MGEADRQTAASACRGNGKAVPLHDHRLNPARSTPFLASSPNRSITRETVGMMSALAPLIDMSAITIVIAGTWAAAAARSGRSGIASGARALLRLWHRGFDAGANRAALARCALSIRQNGALCSETDLPCDPDTAGWVERFLATGNVEKLHEAEQEAREKRVADRASGAKLFEVAGELAPVFGLVGTLFAITQLMPGTATQAAETIMSSLASAVLSTLYGVLSAHLLYFPLARAIERRGEAEERARAAMMAWFLKETGPHRTRKASRLRDAA